MKYLPETTLIETIDGIQFKTYSNSHPDAGYIVRPRYIPQDKMGALGMKSRFLFLQAVTRFNPFAEQSVVRKYIATFKKKYPAYFYDSKEYQNWFFIVPEKKIKKIYDEQAGVQQLMRVDKKDLDQYLLKTVELIEFLTKSGVPIKKFGITNSTLFGNYTVGKSDIDIVVFGKKNGWKVLKFLEAAQHELLRWKTDVEWREYYKTHKSSTIFTEDEFVFHSLRKTSEGLWNGWVFTLFFAEEKNELWQQWGKEKAKPLGLTKIQATVTDANDSIVRPARYKIKDTDNITGVKTKLPITEVVTYSLPFMMQAKKAERIEAYGLLEEVTPATGKKFARIVIGYFDTYLNDRREKEYLKTIR